MNEKYNVALCEAVHEVGGLSKTLGASYTEYQGI